MSVPKLPLPVWAVIVGGGIGGAMFLARKLRGAQTQNAQGTPQQILPSVPIMLGSLQQSILDLQGQVGSGFGGLTSTVSNEQSTLSQNVADATSSINSNITGAQAALSGQLTTVGGQITDTITATGQQYTDALQQRSDALSKEIAGLGTQITNIGTGQDALKQTLSDAQAALQSQLSGVNTALASVNQGIQTTQTEVGSLQAGQSALGSQLTGIGATLSALQVPSASGTDWSAFNGSKFYTLPGSNGQSLGFAVESGKLYAYQSQPNFDSNQSIFRGFLNVSPEQIFSNANFGGTRP